MLHTEKQEGQVYITMWCGRGTCKSKFLSCMCTLYIVWASACMLQELNLSCPHNQTSLKKSPCLRYIVHCQKILHYSWENRHSMQQASKHTPIADLLTGELQLPNFTAESWLWGPATVAGELQRDAAGWTWTRVTLFTADVSITGEWLPTLGITGWKVTRLTAPHLETKETRRIHIHVRTCICIHVILYS